MIVLPYPDCFSPSLKAGKTGGVPVSHYTVWICHAHRLVHIYMRFAQANHFLLSSTSYIILLCTSCQPVIQPSFPMFNLHPILPPSLPFTNCHCLWLSNGDYVQCKCQDLKVSSQNQAVCQTGIEGRDGMVWQQVEAPHQVDWEACQQGLICELFQSVIRYLAVPCHTCTVF